MMIPPENFAHDTLPPATCNPQLSFGALPCDAYHHYYHYQSSAQYLLLAKILLAMGRREEANQAITKCLFQDHFNAEALAFRQHGAWGDAVYDKHPLRDDVFCVSIGETINVATALHDCAVAAGDLPAAIALYQEAIVVLPTHSNSHYGLAMCLSKQQEFQQALQAVQEAIRLSHIAHDAYHRTASDAHVQRGREFMERGEHELAINDFTKALDLYRTNAEATQLCEQLRQDRAL